MATVRRPKERRDELAVLTHDTSEPIDCGQSLTRGTWTASSPSEGVDQICVDAPAEGEEEGELNSNSTLTVRDAGVIAGPAASTVSGSTASVPFTFDYSGAATGEAFALSATTSVPGASASPATTTIAGSEGSTGDVVSVAVPASAAPGSYQVTLTAKLPDGESRSAVDTLQVTAPAVSPTPAASPSPTPTPTKACTVPSLLKLTKAKAKTRLAADGCALGNVSSRHAKVKRGEVISQSSKAGKSLGAGAKVSIVLSSGPKPHKRHSKEPGKR